MNVGPSNLEDFLGRLPGRQDGVVPLAHLVSRVRTLVSEASSDGSIRHCSLITAQLGLLNPRPKCPSRNPSRSHKALWPNPAQRQGSFSSDSFSFQSGNFP